MSPYERVIISAVIMASAWNAMGEFGLVFGAVAVAAVLVLVK